MANSLLDQNINDDDMAIMIVNIIICFNSISNMLKIEVVRSWIVDFSRRLIEAAKPDF